MDGQTSTRTISSTVTQVRSAKIVCLYCHIHLYHSVSKVCNKKGFKVCLKAKTELSQIVGERHSQTQTSVFLKTDKPNESSLCIAITHETGKNKEERKPTSNLNARQQSGCQLGL